MNSQILTRIPEPDEPIQDPRYWAARFGQLTLQAIRAGYPVNEVYQSACIAGSHAREALGERMPMNEIWMSVGSDVPGGGAN